MARPRADGGTASARSRIEAAFWDMLAAKPYSEITVGALSKRAGVNHNTFYYHFRSLEDLGFALIDDTVENAPLDLALDALLHRRMTARELFATTPAIAPTFARAALVARSGSASLIAHLRGAVKARWMERIEADAQSARPEFQFLLTFLVGGMLTALGDYGAEDLEEHLPTILDTGLGTAIAGALMQLGQEQAEAE